MMSSVQSDLRAFSLRVWLIDTDLQYNVNLDFFLCCVRQ